MFCKTTYYALIVMVEAALVYGSDRRLDLAFVSQKHAIPLDAFEGVLEVLQEKHMIGFDGAKLQLQRAPDKITVWQIITEVAEDNIFRERYLDLVHPTTPTSIITMLHKEREKMLKMIENRLRRHKLSDWSEAANKTIYI